MVTEPEPGFVPLSERLDRVREFLRGEFVLYGPSHAIDGHDLGGYLATIDDAIEALQMGEMDSSQDHARAVSGGREDAPTWRPIETAPRDGTLFLACQYPDKGAIWFKSWEQWKAPQTVAWRGFHPNAPGKQTWRDAKGSPVSPDLWMPLSGLQVWP